jgi:hypothetical protein
LRPRSVPPTDMNYTGKDPVTGADLLKPQQRQELMRDYKIHDPAYMQSCYTCHR